MINQGSFSQSNKIEANPFSTNSKLSTLPQNYAENVLYLEMQMEQRDLSLQDVLALIDLYRIGIEHFELCQNDIHLNLQKKTQILLMRPNVQIMFQTEKENLTINKQQSFEQIVHLAKQQITSRQVNQMVQDHSQTEKLLQQKMQDQIIQQEQMISERRKKRSSQSGRPFLPQQSIWDNMQCDSCSIDTIEID